MRFPAKYFKTSELCVMNVARNEDKRIFRVLGQCNDSNAVEILNVSFQVYNSVVPVLDILFCKV